MANEPEKPRRGRPREEYWHAMLKAMPPSRRRKRGARGLKDDLAQSWLRNLFEPGANVFDPSYKPPLPTKVAIEIGRLFFADDEAQEMGWALGDDETDEATRAELRTKIHARLPQLRKLYELALDLKTKGWGAHEITAALRGLRLGLTQTQPRADWQQKYDRAVNALYLAAQRRAFELKGPEGGVPELTRRLLEDALDAAAELSCAGRIKE